MSESGGKIMVEQAYAQGKMLDHSSWKLVRGITPSDIDFAVESNGHFLFAELTRGNAHAKWLSNGQRRLYAAAVEHTPKNIVVICGHTVPIDRQIDTKNDVTSIHVLSKCGVDYHNANAEEANAIWCELVTRWAATPSHVVRVMQEHGNAAIHGLIEQSRKRNATRFCA